MIPRSLRWLVPVAGGLLLWAFTMSSPEVGAGESPSGSADDGSQPSDQPHSGVDPQGSDEPQSNDELVAQGRDLFEVHCSACHGDDGGGVTDKGPDIRSEGAAAADFVLRTGRMPMADPGHQAERGPVRFSSGEIEALVAFVAALGDGPGIPEVDIDGADIANGGNIFRLNCAACHIASGSGAIIGGGYRAPDVMQATPTQVGEAMIVGPGAMPVFSDFTSEEVADVAAYIDDLQRRHTTDVRSLGGIGPVAEGLAAWLVAMVVLVGLTRWMGSSHRARRHGREVT